MLPFYFLNLLKVGLEFFGMYFLTYEESLFYPLLFDDFIGRLFSLGKFFLIGWGTSWVFDGSVEVGGGGFDFGWVRDGIDAELGF